MLRWVAFLIISSTVISYEDRVNVTGLIKDGIPFRILCYVNSTDRPNYSMVIRGYTFNDIQLFIAGATLSDYSYRIHLYTNAINTTIFADYNGTYTDDSGHPAMPLVMGFEQGTFSACSYQKLLKAPISTQAESIILVDVVANRANMVSCTPVECFTGN